MQLNLYNMKAYAYFNKVTNEHCICTGVAGLARAIDKKYNTVEKWFRGGVEFVETEKHLIFRSEVIKGLQKVHKK